jgi:hypothetical protein
MTADGGASNSGAVFSLDKFRGEHIVYSFKGRPDGATSFGGLITVKGTLYGEPHPVSRPARPLENRLQNEPWPGLGQRCPNPGETRPPASAGS